MNTRTVVLAQVLPVAAFYAVPSFAGDDEELKKDLTAVIALQGLPSARSSESRCRLRTTTPCRARTQISIAFT